MEGYPVQILDILYNNSSISSSNPLPVSLGSNTITITGPVTIPAEVLVYSEASNPVHVHIVESIPLILNTSSNTIGNVNINGVVPVSLCNLPISTYLSQSLPTGSNTIGNVNVIGTIPISLCNVEIGTYLTQPLPVGSNTIGNVNVNVKNSNVSDLNPFPVKMVAPTTSKDHIKVSTSDIVFFNTFQYGIETDVWETSTQNGGSAIFTSNMSGVIMEVSGQSNSEVIRQTRNAMRYIPGRGAELTFGVRFTTPVPGIRRRIGLYNGSDGFYFEDDGGDYACVLVNSYGSNGTPYLERVSRSNWNGDKLDGFGDSKITASADAMQMVNFEYEWYGAGQVIFKFIIDGHPRIIHTFNTGNRLAFPWSRTPFLPIRLEIKNIGGISGTHDLYQFSNSLTNQGFTEKLGIAQSILTPVTGINLQNAQTFYPIISIRLKSTALQGIVLPSFFQVATLDNANIFYKLIRNTTIPDGTWVDMPDTNSFTQYNMTAILPITDGTDIDAGFIPSGTNYRVQLDKDTVYQIGRSSLGTVSDTLTLAAACSIANKTVIASMTWIEQR